MKPFFGLCYLNRPVLTWRKLYKLTFLWERQEKGVSQYIVRESWGYILIFVSAVSERVPLDPCRTSQLPGKLSKAVLIDHLVDSEGNIVRAVSIALTTRPARLAVCVISAGLIYKGHLPLDQRASGGTKITRCRLRRDFQPSPNKAQGTPNCKSTVHALYC